MGQNNFVYICFIWLLIHIGFTFSFAQTVTTIYAGGNGPSDTEFVENRNQSNCPLQLTVNIPYIGTVNVVY